MCGLFGVFMPLGTAPAKPDMAAALAAIAHRGPDGERVHESDDGRFRLGFRRLAIIDLKTGDQPIVSPDGRHVLAGNGEIYNFHDVRAAHPDYPYATSGDMEPALAAFRAKGADFVDDLNGMFALAVYDARRHALVLARDRFGIKPLYVARLAGGGIAFASEIKALAASGLVCPAVDDEAANLYLAHGYVPAPRTLWQGIEKLAPGHVMTVDADGAVETRRYWRPQAAVWRPVDEGEAAEHLLGLLDESVRRHLQSDVPVGALLSGGIDSGLLVALAAKAQTAPVSTFTVRFEGTDYDETPLAEAVARRYGTTHHVLDVSPADTSRLEHLAWMVEEPLNDAAVLPNALIHEQLRTHVTVALNGAGGDELFAGYGRYFRLPVEARYARLPQALRTRVVEPLVRRFDPMLAWKLSRARHFAGDRGFYLHAHSTHFPEPMRRRIGNAMVPPPAAQSAAFRAFDGDADGAALAADIETYLAEDLMLLLDRTSMAASVEGRVPFLDHTLVEAALAVPAQIRTPGGRQKALERRMGRNLLPEAVLAAGKKGFVSPVPVWLKGALGTLARDRLCGGVGIRRGWWRADGAAGLLDDPAEGYRAYSLLMLELAGGIFQA